MPKPCKTHRQVKIELAGMEEPVQLSHLEPYRLEPVGCRLWRAGIHGRALGRPLRYANLSLQACGAAIRAGDGHGLAYLALFG